MNNIPTSSRLEKALAHHRAGRLSEAEAIYRELTEADPANAHALYYLGVVMLQRNEPVTAVELMDRAIRHTPARAELLSHRGLAAAALGQHLEAIGFYRRALEIAPDFADAHCNLAGSLRGLQPAGDALTHYRRALELRPQYSAATHGLGSLLEAMGRDDEAIPIYERAVKLAPDDADTLLRLGRLLKRTHRYAEAAPCLERVVALAPGHVDARFDLAYVYDAQRQFDDALQAYRDALALQPHSPNLHNNLAFTLTSVARYDEAEWHYREAIRLNPVLYEAHYQLGMLLLRRGEFRQGWALFEYRKTTVSGVRNYGVLPFAEWRGEPLRGKRLLLAREQGAGDQIQFIRYAALLQQFGATVDAWVHEDLATLCAGIPGIHQVLTEAPASGYDYWCRMMSVPSVLPANAPVPSQVPYLFADPASSEKWRNRLEGSAGGTRKIGLVWAGNPKHHFDAFRSLSLSTLAPLASLPDITWFALQKGPAQNQLADVASVWPIQALGDDLHAYSDTAALIDGLDLVITVDTSIAHLAGALGKPVWVLLAAQSDWRWMLDRPDSIWYPTARLFRQTKSGEWGDVIRSVKAALP